MFRRRRSTRPTAIRSRRRSRGTSRRACRRRRTAIRAMPIHRQHTLPPQTAQDHRRHAVGQRRVAGRGTPAPGTRRCRTACSRPRRRARSSTTRADGAPYFVTHHQPFNYFARFAPGTRGPRTASEGLSRTWCRHRQGRAAAGGVLQAQGALNEHPGYADVLSGDKHIAELVARIKASPLWASTAIIVTYDENGGFWDHVPPPEAIAGDPDRASRR